jgi:2-polyprenyl-3-methyl-5-hydroxy-6-metoxy-1,4-benzoquinol methylase
MATSTNNLIINTCPVCGGKHLKHKMNCKDHYVSGETFELMTCDDCRFIFTQGFPAEDKIGRYYDTPDYISHSDTHRGPVNMVYHHVRRYMLGRKARLVCRNTGIRKGGQLLDIGAGTGYFAATMVSRGWNVVAIEKNEHARDLAKRTFGLELRPAEALYSDMTHDSFDAVTLWHVMEHLEHLNETWERIGSLLKENGLLVVAVPNPSSYDAAKYGEQWAAYDVPRHLWHFTPSAIGRLASNHGFKLKGSYAMPFDAFYISMLSEKYAGSKHPFLSGMATGTAAWLKTLGNKELSSSMIYIFRKDKA